MSSAFDSTYTTTFIRFWRVNVHREALNVLAEAISPSSEADYLEHEWSLIQAGNRAEFHLRRDWALKLAIESQASEGTQSDPLGWTYSPTWHHISMLYGPPQERHRACLCKWLHMKPYPMAFSAHGGAGDAGGRARRLIADLDSAVAQLRPGMSERDNEIAIARSLGWLPSAEAMPAQDRETAG